MPKPYVVNVSSIQDFMQCRYRWYCKWVLNRVPRQEGPALAAGKLLHTIFERHFQTGCPLEVAATRELYAFQCLLQTFSEQDRSTGEKAVALIKDLRDAFPLWQDTYPMEVPVLEVEQPFEITFAELPDVILRGRPDRVCVMSGAVWHVQNRGLAASMNLATYARLAKRHYHEHLYAEHLSRKYADLGDCGGTLFNLVRKLKFRTNAGKKNEKTKTAAEMFWQHPMSINLKSQQHQEVMRALFQHVREMMWCERRIGYRPPPNEKMNGGFSGSAEDPYFKVLIGEIGIADNRYFKDREDTYAVPDEGIE